MKPTSLRALALAALICAVAGWLLTRALYDNLPPLPWTGVPALLLLAAGEGWTGWNLRGRLRRGKRSATPIQPIAVARVAALAKASSQAASLIGGLAAGFLVYVAGSLGKSADRSDAYAAAGTLIAAALLLVAALYLEYGCRVPPRDDAPGQAAGPAG